MVMIHGPTFYLSVRVLRFEGIAIDYCYRESAFRNLISFNPSGLLLVTTNIYKKLAKYLLSN